MATLIPAKSTCLARMTNGEKRFAERLEQKLEDDYCCWFNVAIGNTTAHPDFIICHPGRGLLVLEVKDWKPDTLISLDKESATLLVDGAEINTRNPLEQARTYMHQIASLLQNDPMLVFSGGGRRGDVMFPLAHGVVLTNITRQQFDKAELDHVLPAHLVICKDEMTESVDVEAFQQRLWQMFPYQMRISISLPQLDRIRWHIFPEVRMPEQQDLFADPDGEYEIPDILRIMDMQQEQLARSLGDGHRVIHGVAGSGKTMILGYRAEHLAQFVTQPILILCYNSPLADYLKSLVHRKGLTEKVNVATFHSWCTSQLKTYGITLPRVDGDDDRYFRELVERVISHVDNRQIPGGQYDAILIDEGHDFEPAWFKLIVQMVNPESKRLLVLYDDAQAIYKKRENKLKSFKSVGIEAVGHTTILKLNYRNTVEILAVAKAFAAELLQEKRSDEDQIQRINPLGSGRHGPAPLLIELPSVSAEADYLADEMQRQNRLGMSWRSMAAIYRHKGIRIQLENACRRRGIPLRDSKNHQDADAVHLLTMHRSKGLEFPLVCIPAVGAPFQHAESTQEEAQLLYVAMTRATEQLVMTHGAESCFAGDIRRALSVSH